jgi:hypothetical protein
VLYEEHRWGNVEGFLALTPPHRLIGLRRRAQQWARQYFGPDFPPGSAHMTTITAEPPPPPTVETDPLALLVDRLGATVMDEQRLGRLDGYERDAVNPGHPAGWHARLSALAQPRRQRRGMPPPHPPRRTPDHCQRQRRDSFAGIGYKPLETNSSPLPQPRKHESDGTSRRTHVWKEPHRTDKRRPVMKSPSAQRQPDRSNRLLTMSANEEGTALTKQLYRPPEAMEVFTDLLASSIASTDWTSATDPSQCHSGST